MKHAILVMGYGDYAVLQQTINILDDDDIDFIIHWDKKYSIPNLFSKHSKLFFLNNRINVNWGTDTQTIAEKMLMEFVYNSSIQYDYVHLISSNDMPLMDKNYFKKFFKKESYYIGFVDYLEPRMINRLKYYFPVRNLNLRSNKIFWLSTKLLLFANKLIGVDRLKGKNIEKGCNWFSMDYRYIKKIVSFNHFNMFLNTINGDEFYVQTILQLLKPNGCNNKYNYYSDDYRMTKSSAMALRYIDWIHGRGKPYVFEKSDANLLQSLVNTKYAFGRKVSDPDVIRIVFGYYSKSENDK